MTSQNSKTDIWANILHIYFAALCLLGLIMSIASIVGKGSSKFLVSIAIYTILVFFIRIIAIRLQKNKKSKHAVKFAVVIIFAFHVSTSAYNYVCGLAGVVTVSVDVSDLDLSIMRKVNKEVFKDESAFRVGKGVTELSETYVIKERSSKYYDYDLNTTTSGYGRAQRRLSNNRDHVLRISVLKDLQGMAPPDVTMYVWDKDKKELKPIVVPVSDWGGVYERGEGCIKFIEALPHGSQSVNRRTDKMNLPDWMGFHYKRKDSLDGTLIYNVYFKMASLRKALNLKGDELNNCSDIKYENGPLLGQYAWLSLKGKFEHSIKTPIKMESHSAYIDDWLFVMSGPIAIFGPLLK
mgnify:CR=1 FL=1